MVETPMPEAAPQLPPERRQKRVELALALVNGRQEVDGCSRTEDQAKSFHMVSIFYIFTS